LRNCSNWWIQVNMTLAKISTFGHGKELGLSIVSEAKVPSLAGVQSRMLGANWNCVL
jgi:hypothetical protein